MKRAFTLIELLVVLAVIALLMAILMPSLNRARLQAKIVAVNAELKQIGVALDIYMQENNGKHPPTREDCMQREHYHQLPKELVEGGYLPGASTDTWMVSGMEDRFNRGYTYKYRGVGDVIIDRNRIHSYLKAKLWIPNGFPGYERDSGKTYQDPQISPVTWVIYSQGPKFDGVSMARQHYPVPRKTWYDPQKKNGVITRIRLKKGTHIGSFEGYN